MLHVLTTASKAKTYLMIRSFLPFESTVCSGNGSAEAQHSLHGARGSDLTRNVSPSAKWERSARKFLCLAFRTLSRVASRSPAATAILLHRAL